MKNDLKVGAAHGLRGLDDPGADLLDGGLHHSRDIGGGCDDQHDDDRAVAQAGAEDELCYRQHGESEVHHFQYGSEPDHIHRRLYSQDHSAKERNVRHGEPDCGWRSR